MLTHPPSSPSHPPAEEAKEAEEGAEAAPEYDATAFAAAPLPGAEEGAGFDAYG